MPTTTDDIDAEIKLHLEESDQFKRDWFNSVHKSVQQLHDKIETNAMHQQKEKEELLKLLMQYRADLVKIIQDTNVKHKEDLEKIKDNLSKIIDDIKSNLGTLTNDNIHLRLLIETELNVLKQEVRTNLEEALKLHIESDDKKFKDLEEKIKEVDGKVGEVDEKIGTVNTVQTILKTKVGVYVVLLSLIMTGMITTFTGGLVVIFKESILAYLGVK